MLGLRAAEIAELLETTATAVHSALQRARAALRERLFSHTQQTAATALGDGAVAALALRVVEAFEEGDVDEIVALLTEDVAFEMPPYAECAKGREEVARSWLIPHRRPTGLRLLQTTANGQLAFGVYSLDTRLDRYLLSALDVVELRGGRVCRIIAFRTPDAFPPACLWRFSSLGPSR